MTVAQLCLGTASWATEPPYHGRIPPRDDELRRILDVAEARGIRWLDTARAYGNAEARLADFGAYGRFRVVTKYGRVIRSTACEAALHGPEVVLSHLQPDEEPWIGVSSRPGPKALCGASVYTVQQARQVLARLGACGYAAEWDLWRIARVLQVPWFHRPGDDAAGWDAVRDAAYRDGVLFFGRQPFAGRTDLDDQTRRRWWEWALRTNPRGWCVVGVETADQVTQLCDWREALADA